MGDHRFDVSIKFDFHGKTYTFGPCWLNWAPSEIDDIDQRIVEFFRESVADAMRRFDEQTFEAEKAAMSAERERQDKAEYARLKAKYDGASGGGRAT